MRFATRLLVVFTLVTLALTTAAGNSKHAKLPAKILSAKFIFFEDRTGADRVGNKALERLKKWRRYQIVQDPKKADLVILLSADPYNGGYILTAGGQTGSMGSGGNLDLDPVPNYNRAAPTRVAYLTVIDAQTGVSLWSDSHVWGGLLTGFDSVGETLVKKLEKQVGR
jgi:hypothetical protein